MGSSPVQSETQYVHSLPFQMNLTTYAGRAIHEIILDVGFNFQQLHVPAETLPELQKMMSQCWCKEPESRY